MVNAVCLVAWQSQAGHETGTHLEPKRGGSLFTVFSKSHHVTRAFRKPFLIAPVFSHRNMRRKLRLVIGIHKGGCFFFWLLSTSVFVWFCVCVRDGKTVGVGACGLKNPHKPYNDVVSLLKQTFLVHKSLLIQAQMY